MSTSGRGYAWLAMAGVGVALAVAAGTVMAAGQATPQVKQVPCEPLASVEGKDTFAAYCATCHGADGKGKGPVAAALKMPVPDLTLLAKRRGKFDPLVVERLVAGEDKPPAAHGTVAMPVWGPLFRATDVDRHVATLRLQNLVKYLQTLQAT